MSIHLAQACPVVLRLHSKLPEWCHVNFGNWMKIADTVMSLWEPRRPPSKATAGGEQQPFGDALQQGSAPGFVEQLELRLTNVVIAALKEAFDRDNQRLELERTHLEEQRRIAEEAARMEMKRQIIHHEVGRMRLLAGISLIGWIIAIIVLALRHADMSIFSKTVLAGGWLLFIASLTIAFSAQAKLNTYLLKPITAIDIEAGGNGALWCLVGGLALSAVSLLL